MIEDRTNSERYTSDLQTSTLGNCAQAHMCARAHTHAHTHTRGQKGKMALGISCCSKVKTWAELHKDNPYVLLIQDLEVMTVAQAVIQFEVEAHNKHWPASSQGQYKIPQSKYQNQSPGLSLPGAKVLAAE